MPGTAASPGARLTRSWFKWPFQSLRRRSENVLPFPMTEELELGLITGRISQYIIDSKYIFSLFTQKRGNLFPAARNRI